MLRLRGYLISMFQSVFVVHRNASNDINRDQTTLYYISLCDQVKRT